MYQTKTKIQIGWKLNKIKHFKKIYIWLAGGILENVFRMQYHKYY